MHHDVSFNKASLRLEIQKRIQELSPNAMKRAGHAVADHIEQWLQISPELLPRRRVALFKNLKDELMTAYVANLCVSLELELCYPAFGADGTMSFSSDGQNAFKASECDLIFVPGQAFDRAGHRLGRGLGCYDRALKDLALSLNNTLCIGLALDIQVVEQVPVETHDVRMHFICSPTLGLLKTSE